MNRKVKDFEDRFEISGIRANIPGRKTYCTNSGYRLMFPKGNEKSYFSFASPKSIAKADYMLKVATIRQPRDGSLLEVYEQDIVDYRKEDGLSRALGVVIYDKEKFMIAIKDVKTYETIPFYQVKIFNVLGSIYDIPEVIEMDLESAYEHLEMTYIKEKPVSESAEHKSAAGTDSIPHPPVTDVYVDVFSLGKKTYWSYRICQGTCEKKDAKPFKTPGIKSGDQHISAAIIALSNITGPCDIRLHTHSEILYKLFCNNSLSDAEICCLLATAQSQCSNLDGIKELHKIACSIKGTITPIMEAAAPA